MNPYSSNDYTKQAPRSTQQTGSMYEIPSQQQGLPPLPNANNASYDPYSYGGYYNTNNNTGDDYNGYDTVNYNSEQQPVNSNYGNEYGINQQQQQYDPYQQQQQHEHEQQQEQQQPLTEEQLARKRFALTNILLLVLSILLVVGCVLSTIIRALDLSGVKSIVSLVFSALLNLAVIIVCLIGIVSSLLNKSGQEKLRYKTTMLNMLGLIVIGGLETFYLIISNILIPLLGIAMFFIGMIFVVVFYGPCIAVAVYRYMLMRKIPGAIPADVTVFNFQWRGGNSQQPLPQQQQQQY